VPRPRLISDEAVLDAVAMIVEHDGPGAVTFSRVAEHVGLAPATLVQRFRTKRGLLLATTIRGWYVLIAALDRARMSRGSPTEALLAAMVELTRDVRTRKTLANGIAFLYHDLSDPEFHRHAVAGTNAMRACIDGLLTDAVAAGELMPTDTQRLASAVQTTYTGALITWAMSDHGSVQDWLRSEIEFLLLPFRADTSGPATLADDR
jgi:AcrR family transcriptional regulator